MNKREQERVGQRQVRRIEQAGQAEQVEQSKQARQTDKANTPLVRDNTYERIAGIYGVGVINTNGLYRIYDNKHMERYINPTNYHIDRRAKYRTLRVYNSIVVAKILNNSVNQNTAQNIVQSKQINYVILNKKDLSLLYKIDGAIIYIDNNIICYINTGKFSIISHNGKEIYSDDTIWAIHRVYKNSYLLKSNKLFSDSIVIYNEYADELSTITKEKRYSILKIKGNEPLINITSMAGGEYTYNFKTKESINKFTGQEEFQTYLWSYN